MDKVLDPPKELEQVPDSGSKATQYAGSLHSSCDFSSYESSEHDHCKVDQAPWKTVVEEPHPSDSKNFVSSSLDPIINNIGAEAIVEYGVPPVEDPWPIPIWESDPVVEDGAISITSFASTPDTNGIAEGAPIPLGPPEKPTKFSGLGVGGGAISNLSKGVVGAGLLLSVVGAGISIGFLGIRNRLRAKKKDKKERLHARSWNID